MRRVKQYWPAVLAIATSCGFTPAHGTASDGAIAGDAIADTCTPMMTACDGRVVKTCGDDHHCFAICRCGMEQAPDGFAPNGSDRDHQEQGVEQGRKDWRFLEAIRESGRCRATCNPRRRPGDDEAEYIRKIVARVGDQGDRVGVETKNCFDGNETEVECNSDCERCAERSRLMRMRMAIVFCVRMAVGVGMRDHGHRLAD